MNSLHHLAVATGYIELGLYLDANSELEEIAPEGRALPEVLKVRVAIYRSLKWWDLMALSRSISPSWSRRKRSTGLIGRMPAGAPKAWKPPRRFSTSIWRATPHSSGESKTQKRGWPERLS